MFADYFLQTKAMIEGREVYVHSGRAQHAGLHAVFSAVVLGLFGTSISLLLILIVAEFVLHFHIDYWKARHSKQHQHTPADAGFWRAAGFDQALHQLTYIAMVAIWVAA